MDGSSRSNLDTDKHIDLFPLYLQGIFRLPFLRSENAVPKILGAERLGLTAADPAAVLKKAQADLAGPSGEAAAQVIEVLPRLKEGGAFIKFSHGSATTPLEIRAAVSRHLMQEQQSVPWYLPTRRVRAGLVMGVPWVEDLYRMPSSRVKVEFLPTAPGGEVADLSQEQLYAYFRPYGKLADIVTQPADSKVLPKFAYLDFARIAKAVMAKVRLSTSCATLRMADRTELHARLHH